LGKAGGGAPRYYIFEEQVLANQIHPKNKSRVYSIEVSYSQNFGYSRDSLNYG
jgi:hypothetical protein